MTGAIDEIRPIAGGRLELTAPLITCHGTSVARLVPAEPRIRREETRAAPQRIRDRAERAQRGTLDREDRQLYRGEGRTGASCPVAVAWIHPDEASPAQRRGLPLASLDRAPRVAAEGAGAAVAGG